MYRFSALTLSLMGSLLAGCAGQTSHDDPFFGCTRVPPPSTGAVTGRAADPYYKTPPVVQMPPAAAPCPATPGGTIPGISPTTPATTTPATTPATTPGTPTPAPASPYSPSAGATTSPTTSQPGFSQNMLAPRPLSTSPSRSTAAQGTPAYAPRYVPPANPATTTNGASTYPGVSTSTLPSANSATPSTTGPSATTPPVVAPSAVTPAPAQPNSASAAPQPAPVAVSRIGSSSADRSPRPVDDGGGPWSVAGRGGTPATPAASSAVPPGGRAADVPDITDLPKAR
ncbi:MAG: hypothetical protein ABFC63_04105 [Thermoguttaceae bacterium]